MNGSLTGASNDLDVMLAVRATFDTHAHADQGGLYEILAGVGFGRREARNEGSQLACAHRNEVDLRQ